MDPSGFSAVVAINDGSVFSKPMRTAPGRINLLK